MDKVIVIPIRNYAFYDKYPDIINKIAEALGYCNEYFRYYPNDPMLMFSFTEDEIIIINDFLRSEIKIEDLEKQDYILIFMEW